MSPFSLFFARPTLLHASPNVFSIFWGGGPKPILCQANGIATLDLKLLYTTKIALPQSGDSRETLKALTSLESPDRHAFLKDLFFIQKQLATQASQPPRANYRKTGLPAERCIFLQKDAFSCRSMHFPTKTAFSCTEMHFLIKKRLFFPTLKSFAAWERGESAKISEYLRLARSVPESVPLSALRLGTLLWYPISFLQTELLVGGKKNTHKD